MDLNFKGHHMNSGGLVLKLFSCLPLVVNKMF